jgi:hypothetical protein
VSRRSAIDLLHGPLEGEDGFAEFVQQVCVCADGRIGVVYLRGVRVVATTEQKKICRFIFNPGGVPLEGRGPASISARSS